MQTFQFRKAVLIKVTHYLSFSFILAPLVYLLIVSSCSTSNLILATCPKQVVITHSKDLTKEVIANREDSGITFIIKGDVDLEGKTLVMPPSCTLSFKKGSIRNGCIVFNYTKIKAPSFINCSFRGRIILKKIDDRCFDWKDDTKLLKWLIEQTADNGSMLSLHKDYRIKVKGTIGQPYISLYRKTFSIEGNNHTIYNAYEFDEGEGSILIHAKECHHIIISNLGIEDTGYDNCSIELRKVVQGTGGDTFLRLTGDTDNVKIVNGRIRHASSYIFAGIDPHGEGDFRDNRVINGFTNLDLDIDAYDVGYAVAVYVGADINVKLKVLYAHRGCRLQGVRNAKVSMQSAYMTTPVSLLLSEGAGYTDNSFKIRKFHSCSKINAHIERITLDDEKRVWNDVACNIKCYSEATTLATAEVYKKRTEPYLWDKINLEIIGDFRNGLVLWPYTNNNLEDYYNVIVKSASGCPNIINRVDDSVPVVSEDAMIDITFVDSRIGKTYVGGVRGKSKLKLKNTLVEGGIIENGNTMIIKK